MPINIIRKLFYYPNYFTVAIRRKTNPSDSLFTNLFFASEIELKGTRKNWSADPMLVEDGKKTWLFYEACHNDKGRIEVIQLFDDGKYSDSQVVLEEDFHLSYPFVFKKDDFWYMIPESCSCNQVRLYKAKEFPYIWEFEQTILNDYAVDTTIYKMGKEFLMVTFLAQHDSEAVIPRAYLMTWEKDDIRLQQLEWNDYDTSKVRGAGAYVEWDGVLFRPAQISKNGYGDGLQFEQVLLQEDMYIEEDCFCLWPKDIKFNRYPFDGTHTYTSSAKFEAIDVRCSFFDLLKPFKRIVRIVSQRK